jgi:hypothetical protein
MESLNLSSPQFSKAEYGKPTQCGQCNQPVGASYYMANGVLICDACGERLKREGFKGRSGAFMKALATGAVAAILGLILYAGFTILTGIYIGYVSLAVGFIIGKGIMIGSGGVGGRKYQIAALILTYASVSMAAIPIAIHQMSITKVDTPQPQHQATPSASDPGGEAPQQGTSPQEDNKMSFAGALGQLALIGLASPFLELADGVGGIIGLVILFVGLRIAWKITAGSPLELSGPYAAGT